MLPGKLRPAVLTAWPHDVTSKDRREATEADPDQDGEFVDPVDLDSPVTPKLPPFQVQLTLGCQGI